MRRQERVAHVRPGQCHMRHCLPASRPIEDRRAQRGARRGFATMEGVTNRDEILKALEVVIDPELHRSIVELDMVRSIDISPNGVVDVTVSLTTPGCPIKGHFQTTVTSTTPL